MVSLIQIVPSLFRFGSLLRVIQCLVYILIETAQDEKESVKGAFVLSVTFSSSSCLEALGNMSVNHTRVKGHERLASLQATFNFVS